MLRIIADGLKDENEDIGAKKTESNLKKNAD